MMLTMEAYLRQGKRELRRLALDTRVQNLLRVAAYGTGGLALSGAALGGFAQPVAMGVICGVTGWRALVMGLGAVLGSWLFWGSSGLQSMVWSVLGTLLALFEGKRTETEEMPLLIPAAAGCWYRWRGFRFKSCGRKIHRFAYFCCGLPWQRSPPAYPARYFPTGTR